MIRGRVNELVLDDNEPLTDEKGRGQLKKLMLKNSRVPNAIHFVFRLYPYHPIADTDYSHTCPAVVRCAPLSRRATSLSTVDSGAVHFNLCASHSSLLVVQPILPA